MCSKCCYLDAVREEDSRGCAGRGLSQECPLGPCCLTLRLGSPSGLSPTTPSLRFRCWLWGKLLLQDSCPHLISEKHLLRKVFASWKWLKMWAALFPTHQFWIIALLLLFSYQVLSNFMRPGGLFHTRLPCSSLSPTVCSSPCPPSLWCYLNSIWYSVIIFVN